ncbi:MAG: 3-oxoacyl-ACP synthase [Desulfocucumaceae bacterium]
MGNSIISYGAYIPFLRITRDAYAGALGSCGADIKEKAVMDIDEDTLTMAVEAARDALAGVDAAGIGVLALASSNFPYQEKFMAGTIVEALGLDPGVLTSHHACSALAGSEAFLAAMGMLSLTGRKYALVIITDAPSAPAPEDADHGLGAAACAFVLARDEPGLEFEGVHAYCTEYMGLRYRLPGETEIRDIGVREYSSRALEEVVKSSVSGLLNNLDRSSGQYRYAVLPPAGIKAGMALAKKLGFGEDQVKDCMLFDRVGDTGSCAPFLGLCRSLEDTRPGEKVLVCAYGAGSGSHALSFSMAGHPPRSERPVSHLLEKKRHISYIQYLKLKRII